MHVLKKLINKNIRKNCMVCACGISLKLWGIVGAGCFYAKCNHEKTSNIEYKKSKYFYFISTIITGVISITCLCNMIYHLKHSISGINNVIITITDSMFRLNATLIIIFGMLNTPLRINFWQILTEILQKTETLGYGDLLPKNCAKNFRKVPIIFFTTFIIFEFISLSTFWKLFSEFSFLNWLTFCVDLTCFYIDLGIIFEYSLELNVIKYIFDRYLRKYQLIIDSKKSKLFIRANRIINTKVKNNCEEISFKMLYFLLFKAYKTMQKYSSHPILMWCILTTLSTILNTFLLLKTTIDGSFNIIGVKYFILEIRILLTTLILLITLNLFENLANIVSIITASFIFYV